MKDEFKGEFKEEFKEEFRKEFKINEIDRALSDVQSKSKEVDALNEKYKKEIQDTRNYDLEGKVQLLEYLNNSSSSTAACNAVRTLTRSATPLIENNELNQRTLRVMFVSIGNSLGDASNYGFYKDVSYQESLKKLVDMLVKYFDKMNGNYEIKDLEELHAYMNDNYKKLEELFKKQSNDD